MEFLVNRTAKVSDAEAEAAEEKRAKKEARLKLKETRRGLSRDEYEKWVRQQSAAGTDFEVALKGRIAELEKQVSETANEFLIAQLESRIAQTRMLLEAEEASRASDQTARDMEEAEKFVLQEAALQRGPLFSRRMQWWLGDQGSRCARLLNAGWSGLSSTFSKIAAVIGRLYEPAVFTFSVSAILAGLVIAIKFAVTSGLGLNLVFVLAASIVFTIRGLFVFDGSGGKVQQTAMLVMLLTFYGATTFLVCLTPNAGYAGARKQGGKIVEILDSRDWLIHPPAFWRGEKLEWVDLLVGSNGYWGRPHAWNVAFHEDAVSSNKLLACEFDLFLRREGFRELFETGRTPDSYRQELRQRIQAILNQFTQESSLKDINRINAEITRVHNNLFGLSRSRVQLQLQP